MSARAARRPTWRGPAIFDYFERVEDGKVFMVRQVWTKDRQVRLESCSDKERQCPFAPQLETDYRAVVIGGDQ